MSEINYVKVEDQQKLVEVVYDFAVKHEGKFQGIVGTVVSDTHVLAIDVEEQGEDGHYMLIAKGRGDVAALRKFAMDYFTADGLHLSGVAIRNYVEVAKSRVQQERTASVRFADCESQWDVIASAVE